MSDAQPKTLGQIAFEAYNDAKGGLTYDGKPIPGWETLTDDVGMAVRGAWEKAVYAAISEDIRRASVNGLIELARDKIAPKSREASLAITKLDEADMWARRIPWVAP